jgi:hypothetical protein
MKRHVSVALALLVASVALSGCVIEPRPYGYSRHSHWKPYPHWKPHPDHYNHRHYR